MAGSALRSPFGRAFPRFSPWIPRPGFPCLGKCPVTKSGMIRARVEPEFKQEAETVFSKLGLSTTHAITLFYKQVILQQGLPFAVKIPTP